MLLFRVRWFPRQVEGQVNLELSPRYRRVPIRDGATPRWLQFGATSFSEAVHIIYEKYPEVHEKNVDFVFPGHVLAILAHGCICNL